MSMIAAGPDSGELSWRGCLCEGRQGGAPANISTSSCLLPPSLVGHCNQRSDQEIGALTATQCCPRTPSLDSGVVQAQGQLPIPGGALPWAGAGCGICNLDTPMHQLPCAVSAVPRIPAGLSLHSSCELGSGPSTQLPTAPRHALPHAGRVGDHHFLVHLAPAVWHRWCCSVPVHPSCR